MTTAAILCYCCSLLTGRDVPWTPTCRLAHHGWIAAKAWYDRYHDAPYAVETSHHDWRQYGHR